MDNFSFRLINLIDSFRTKKYRIGFAIEDYAPYDSAMASTRLRVYDIIREFFNDDIYLLALYRPLKKYDIVIFQKYFNRIAFELADKLRSQGVNIVLDVNVNYYDSTSKYITNEEYLDIVRFTEISDAVVTTTDFLRDSVLALYPHKKVLLIEEGIEDRYFKCNKIFPKGKINLIWSGYAQKANEILMIKDILEELYEEFKFSLFLICEKDPELKIKKIPVYFERYNHSRIAEQLQKGDIFIAPRDLTDSYNMGHSFTKIGVAMAAGLPVIASPVPSYVNSPAVLCEDLMQWRESLRRMLTDVSYLECLGNLGRDYVKENFSMHKIKPKYKELFANLLEQ